MAKYTPMMEQYLSIKAEYPDAFLFFRLGDFYEMFFEDAKKAAEELEITLTSRDGGKERVPMCGVPYHSADAYIERLIEKGYKVAICEQVEDPKSAKGVVKREVVRVITPGTVIEEKMLADKENNFLVALATDGRAHALAAGDLSTGEWYVTQLEGVLDRLMDETSAYRPREVLLDSVLAGDRHFQKRLSMRLGCLFTPMTEEKLGSIGELEAALAQQFPSANEVFTTALLVRAGGMLLRYLQDTQKRSLRHLNRVRRYDARQFMILDEAARRNLELTATLKDGRRQGSLLWLLDQTATAMGSRMLRQWLDKPLVNKEAIEERQEAVQAFLDDLLLLEEVRERLKEVYDLERLAARIAYGSANARDLQALRRSLEALPALQQVLAGMDCSPLRMMGEHMDVCADVAELIAKAIEDDPPVSVKEGGLIREGYHPYLDRLRKAQREGKNWITQLERREREATGIKSLKVGYNKVFGYYIEVTKANLRHLPEGRYERKQTLANAERFITPELKEKEQLILEAEEKSVELEYQLFTEVREQVARQIPRLQTLAEQVARLDALQSLAAVADRYRYVRPVIRTDGRLRIEAGRHPVVEAANREEPFVANDTEMDPEDRQILLITGPNMAGKSTYMRQVALITVMAQIGSFVPAKRAEIPIVDRIFTRIGAADDLVGGRSTFMVEMAETCQALTQATKQSLILLDEVGRGTSTYDGMSLAHAIVEYIHDHVGAKTLFSTHYHELTRLEETLPRVVNVHARCVEKDGKVVFLHRIEPGRADRSYGIQVAELAGMPQEVIRRAKVILDELEGQAETAAAVQQLELFPSVPETVVRTETVPETDLSETEREVLKELAEWDLMGSTPLDAMQLIHRLQQRLKSIRV